MKVKSEISYMRTIGKLVIYIVIWKYLITNDRYSIFDSHTKYIRTILWFHIYIN